MSVLSFILPSYEIDKSAWNNCIEKSINGLIYANADYLDALCDWEGLVWGDYIAVMPLPYRKKWGIKYYYTPCFVQQLGVFVKDESFLPTYKIISEAIQKVKLADINFNFFNHALLKEVHESKEKVNQILDLAIGYESIYNNYSNDLKRNIKQAASNNLVIKDSTNVEAAINCYKSLYAERMPQVKTNDYLTFTNLCKALLKQGKCFIKEVYDASNQLMACGVFLFDGKRIYNIASSNQPQGRQKSANHFLLDEVIKTYAGKSVVFDFEGSDLTGVQEFYKQFGASFQNYSICRFNRFPAIIKWLKPAL